jgi:hypothetical protein
LRDRRHREARRDHRGGCYIVVTVDGRLNAGIGRVEPASFSSIGAAVTDV